MLQLQLRATSAVQPSLFQKILACVGAQYINTLNVTAEVLEALLGEVSSSYLTPPTPTTCPKWIPLTPPIFSIMHNFKHALYCVAVLLVVVGIGRNLPAKYMLTRRLL